VLVLPGGAVVAVEVGVLLEFGIAVGGQHFAVGVDGDALAGGLLQELLEVLEVMAGHQDGLAGLVAQGHRGGHGVAVRAGVGGVEEFHGAQVHFAALQHQGDPGSEVLVGGEGGGHAFVEEFVHGRVFLAEDGGMVGVGGHALDAENQCMLERPDVVVGLRNVFKAVLGALGDKAGQIEGWDIGGRAFGQLGLDERGQGLALGHGFVDQGHEVGGVEIDVGQRGEHGLGEEAAGFQRHGHAFGLGGHGGLGQAGQGVDKEILQIGDVGLLAANAHFVATKAFGGLFALVAKHMSSSVWVGVGFPFRWFRVYAGRAESGLT